MSQSDNRVGRTPLTNAHTKLGDELRALRQNAGRTLRDLSSYTPGHLSNVENGYVTASKELVEYYTRELNGHRAKLQALYEAVLVAADRRRSNMRLKQAATYVAGDQFNRSSAADLRQRYYFDLSEITYVFDSQRALRQVKQRCLVRAREEVVDLVHFAHFYRSDPRVGVLAISSVENCVVDSVTESRRGAVELLVRPLRPLIRGEDAVEIACNFKITSQKVAEPMLAYEIGARHGHLTVRAIFHPMALPQEIWYFEERNAAFIHRDPSPRDLLPVDDGAVYEKHFQRPVRGWWYGLAWDG
jgi:transcriptional regulator with XRE-family HTH domain